MTAPAAARRPRPAPAPREVRFGEALTPLQGIVRSAFTSGPAIAWVTVFLLVPLLGIPRAPRSTFAVDEVVTGPTGGEALIVADDEHLDFRCGVAVDSRAGLVAVTTNVRLHNRRGRLYLLPVRALHPHVVRSMLARAAHVLTP